MAAIGLHGGSTRASAATLYIHGTITNIHSVPCTSSTGLACTESTVHGDLNGISRSTITSVVLSATTGVIFSDETVVLITPTGQLFNSGSGVANTTGSTGESVLLGELHGGTGTFAGASGYLQVRATFNGASGVPGFGDYQGVLTLP